MTAQNCPPMRQPELNWQLHSLCVGPWQKDQRLFLGSASACNIQHGNVKKRLGLRVRLARAGLGWVYGCSGVGEGWICGRFAGFVLGALTVSLGFEAGGRVGMGVWLEYTGRRVERQKTNAPKNESWQNRKAKQFAKKKRKPNQWSPLDFAHAQQVADPNPSLQPSCDLARGVRCPPDDAYRLNVQVDMIGAGTLVRHCATPHCFVFTGPGILQRF